MLLHDDYCQGSKSMSMQAVIVLWANQKNDCFTYHWLRTNATSDAVLLSICRKIGSHFNNSVDKLVDNALTW